MTSAVVRLVFYHEVISLIPQFVDAGRKSVTTEPNGLFRAD